MEHRCIFSGFGGQGVISMGTLAAYAGMVDGKQVTFFPAYGIAMRGGAANCTVVVSDHDIASPIVNHPNVLVTMNEISLDHFEPAVAPGGFLLVNSTLVKKKVSRPDVNGVYVEATHIAMEHGDGRMANMAMLGAVLKVTDKMISFEAIQKAMEKTFSAKLQKLIGKNLEVMKLGFEQATVLA